MGGLPVLEDDDGRAVFRPVALADRELAVALLRRPLLSGRTTEAGRHAQEGCGCRRGSCVRPGSCDPSPLGLRSWTLASRGTFARRSGTRASSPRDSDPCGVAAGLRAPPLHRVVRDGRRCGPTLPRWAFQALAGLASVTFDLPPRTRGGSGHRARVTDARNESSSAISTRPGLLPRVGEGRAIGHARGIRRVVPGRCLQAHGHHPREPFGPGRTLISTGAETNQTWNPLSSPLSDGASRPCVPQQARRVPCAEPCARHRSA